ncbi:uncharacterized protein F4807DRAFT_37354 [Annulohypoxylon truncatum]|uniref:uncharacterized protein n=1 Tax=Annulohypoxylon truncatum TaxID=327061 RepID=UPI0020087795|nr:uncharacterized protein F4807DRAFT_37354 [Annulohypoxylon truncatum]KAI1211398.1 hypothetical protein F4807DRAFT_37354 [Annulohypoxylon truncatum]
MKTTLFGVLALGGFIVTSIASPVVVDTSVKKRQDIDAIETALETLFTQIQEQTTQINATLTPVQDAAPEAEAQAAADTIAPQLEAISDLLDQAGSIAKRAILEGRFVKEDIFKTVSLILYELLGTVKFILIKLGLGPVLIHLVPLILALTQTLKALDKVVDGLLIAVKFIADDLLKAVGLGLVGLLP